MYYDLIASLPHLPHFRLAERLPMTPLRLEQRLRRLRPDHSDQLNLAKPLIRWRTERMTEFTDNSLITSYCRLKDSGIHKVLNDFIEFRITQQTLLAALRYKAVAQGIPEEPRSWGALPQIHHIFSHWDDPFFRLEHVYPWLPQLSDRLAANDAMGMEQLLIDLNWTWLTRRAEQSMFGFEAVVAFVFKWDMLQAWLQCEPHRAEVRFKELIDKVTHVEDTI